MSERLIKEERRQDGFATSESFIDRWSATAQPASVYMKMEEGDKGSGRRPGVMDKATAECKEAIHSFNPSWLERW